MFDSALCHRTLTKLPVFVSFNHLSFPKVVFLVGILLVLYFGVRYLLQNVRLKRWFRKPLVIFLLFVLTATFPFAIFFSDKAIAALMPPDPGTKADAIVVLGRGWELYHRIEVAADLWEAKRAPRIFISGVSDAPIFIELLEGKGIPNRVLDGENCSITTQENALFSAAILQTQGIRRIILITDPPHMLRSLLVFRAQGFEVIPKLSPFPPYLGFKAETFITLREYMGFIGYGVRGLFFPQPSIEDSNPELAPLIRAAKQYAQQRSF